MSETFEALLFPGLALPDAVPTLRRNIRCPAECEPDRSYGFAGLDRLLGRATADLFKHQVAGQNPTIGIAELVGDRQPEFA